MNFARIMRNRNLIGSDAAIILSCLLHAIEGSLFLTTNTANGTVGMASLLLILRHPWIAAGVMYLFVALAVIAEWAPTPSRLGRFSLMFPQLILLIITSSGALWFVVSQQEPDGIVHPWTYMLCQQMPRIGMPIWYATAILARVRE